MPFGGYTDFDQCVSQNKDKDDPDAYCGSIKHKVEDKMQKTINSASYLHQMVRAALTTVFKHKDKEGSTAHHKGASVGDKHGAEGVTHSHPDWSTGKPHIYTHNHTPKRHAATRGGGPSLRKGHDPVKEEGKKKLTAKDGVANEGAQDDQAFAVAFGPDNYDKLVKRIIKAPYQEAYNAAGTILKALENKQFNFPGNIEDALKKAHAAVHGREMWDARYGDVCDLITQARKILHSIEKTAEVSQGGSGMMVVGKADPGQSEKPKVTQPKHDPMKRRGSMYVPSSPGERQRVREARTHMKPTRKARKGLKQNPMGVSGAGGVAKPGWAQTKQPIPGGGSKPRGDYDFHPGKPPARPKPKAGAGNLPPSGFPHRGAAFKAVQKAVKAVDYEPLKHKPPKSNPFKPELREPVKKPLPQYQPKR